MIKDKILYQPWGGLGDNLQYSTLPKKYSELGINFYISNINTYRNNEIYDLVWGLNPYVKGISNNPPNIGDIKFEMKYPDKNVIYNQEYNHGLNPTNEIPEVYYRPNLLRELKDTIIIDLNSISIPPVSPIGFNETLKELYPNKNILIPIFNQTISNQLHNKTIIYDDGINIESIFHYCDIINSCSHFICSFSGQSVLASALNKKETTCFLDRSSINSHYIFPNISYQIID